MNGIDALIKKISDDSRSECEEKMKKAEQKARGIVEEYRARGEAEAVALRKQAEKAAETTLLRGAGNDEVEASKQILAAKHKAIDEAFRRANEMLCSLSESEYIALLTKYVLAASEAGEESVVLNKKDREALGEKIVSKFNEALSAAGKKAKLSLSGGTADINGGFILRNGDIDTDCSVSSLVEQQKYALTEAVVKLLFS